MQETELKDTKHLLDEMMAGEIDRLTIYFGLNEDDGYSSFDSYGKIPKDYSVRVSKEGDVVVRNNVTESVRWYNRGAISKMYVVRYPQPMVEKKLREHEMDKTKARLEILFKQISAIFEQIDDNDIQKIVDELYDEVKKKGMV